MQENVGGENIEFSKEELQEMEDASSHIKILGERYPEALENDEAVNRKNITFSVTY